MTWAYFFLILDNSKILGFGNVTSFIPLSDEITLCFYFPLSLSLSLSSHDLYLRSLLITLCSHEDFFTCYHITSYPSTLLSTRSQNTHRTMSSIYSCAVHSFSTKCPQQWWTATGSIIFQLLNISSPNYVLHSPMLMISSSSVCDVTYSSVTPAT